jgi:hypothetical protein
MENTELMKMQQAYKAAVEDWVTALREEEALASVDPTVAEVDVWQAAHFREEEARDRAKKAKNEYEDAIRLNIFAF